MGKGGGRQKQLPETKRKQAQPEEESEQEEQNDLEQQGDFEQDDEIDYFDPEISDRDEELLDKINEEIANSEQQSLKLTWAAIHKLKQEQKLLNEQMDNQMRKLQDKFQLLKVPIVLKIANVASGRPVQKEIYTQHELTQNLNVNKIKPKAIPGFWLQSFQSAHFVAGQLDSQILTHCTRVQCVTTRSGQGQTEEQTIKVVLQFADNPLIKNKQLKATVHRKGDQVTVKEVTNVEFKQQVKADEASSFIQIFNDKTKPEQVYSACGDLQRIYNNSVFHYFYEPQIEDDLEGIEGVQGAQEDEDDDDSSDIKPVKKTTKSKSKQLAKPQPPQQKPDCKQQ